MVNDKSVVARLREIVGRDAALVELNNSEILIEPVTPVARVRLVRKFREADVEVRWDQHRGHVNGWVLRPHRTGECTLST